MLAALFRLPPVLILLSLLAAPRLLSAQSADDYLTRIPDPKRLGETYVSNPDGVLDAATVQDLNATLQALDQSGRAHIDVVVAQSIGEAVPKTAATALFNRWKIGDKTKNNGLLMLLVMDQRRVEFETGYGLEADLPDVVCYRIQQRYMLPALRAGLTDLAVRQGVAALLRQLSTGSFAEDGDSTVDLDSTEPGLAYDVPTTSDNSRDYSFFALIGILLLCVVGVGVYVAIWHVTTARSPYRILFLCALLLPPAATIAAMSHLTLAYAGLLLGVVYGLPLLYLLVYFGRVQRTFRATYAGQSRHAQYTYLQQTHHGLGFTAWLFALPLAWYWPRHRHLLQQLRDAPYPCPHCSQLMHRLSETDDDQFLQTGEQVEEQVGSVDYDVWHCDACQQTLKLNYPDPSSEAQKCPECGYLTLLNAGTQVVQRATRSASGWGWKLTRCRHCNYETKERYTIAQLPDPASRSTSSSWSSSSSSSSSSSGSSWSSSSGGSSGGGGAGSSW